MARIQATSRRSAAATRPAAAAGTAAQGSSARWMVLLSVVFGTFVCLLDSTIVNTALPKIQATFGGTLHQASFVATAFIMAAAVVEGSTPYVAARFGTKRVYLASLAAFTLFSALCGAAPSLDMLIVFRVFQGAGGAYLFPLSLALIFASFPREERGLANGIFGIVVLVAPAIGPIIGGYLVQYMDWRAIFYVNVPIGLAGLAFGWRYLPHIPPRPAGRFDLRGFLLLGGGFAFLLYGITNLSYDGWDNMRTVAGPTILGAALLLAYVPLELITPEPLLNLRLFKDWNYAIGSVIQYMGIIALYSVSFFLPQYLQELRGLDPFPSGLAMLPLGVASVVFTIISGFLYSSKIDVRLQIAFGAGGMALATYWIGKWSTLHSAYAALPPLLFLLGAALPFIQITANTVSLQNIPKRELDSGSTMNTVVRQVIAALAVAVLTNTLQIQGKAHLGNLDSQLDLSNPATTQLYNQTVAYFTHQGLTVQQAQDQTRVVMWKQMKQQGTALAYQDVYTQVALVMVPTIGLALLLRVRRRAAEKPEEEEAREESAQSAVA